jgi:hypothetical protein
MSTVDTNLPMNALSAPTISSETNVSELADTPSSSVSSSSETSTSITSSATPLPPPLSVTNTKHPVAFTFKLPSFLSASSANTSSTTAENNSTNNLLRPEQPELESTLSTPVSALSSLPSSLSSPSTPHSPPLSTTITPIAVSAPVSPTTPSQSHIFSPYNRSHVTTTLLPVAVGTRIRLRSPEHLHAKLQQYAFLEGEIVSIPSHPNTWYGIRLFGKGGNKEIKIRNSAFEIVLNDNFNNGNMLMNHGSDNNNGFSSSSASSSSSSSSSTSDVSTMSHTDKTNLNDIPSKSSTPMHGNVNAIPAGEMHLNAMQVVPVTPTPINVFRNGIPFNTNLLMTNPQMATFISTPMSAPATPSHFRSNHINNNTNNYSGTRLYNSYSSIPSTPIETRPPSSAISLSATNSSSNNHSNTITTTDSKTTAGELTRPKSLEVQINEDHAMSIEAPVPLDVTKKKSTKNDGQANEQNDTNVSMNTSNDYSYDQQAIANNSMLPHGIMAQMQSYMSAVYAAANMDPMLMGNNVVPYGVMYHHPVPNDSSLPNNMIAIPSSIPLSNSQIGGTEISSSSSSSSSSASSSTRANIVTDPSVMYNVPYPQQANMNEMMNAMNMNNMNSYAMSHMISQMQQMALMNASSQSPSQMNLNNYNNMQQFPSLAIPNANQSDMYAFQAISGQLLGYPVDIVSGQYSGQSGIIVDLAMDQLLVRVGNENVVKRYSEVGLAAPITMASSSSPASVSSSISSSVSASTSPSSNPSPTHAYSLSITSPSTTMSTSAPTTSTGPTSSTDPNALNSAMVGQNPALVNFAHLQQQMGYFYNPAMPNPADSNNWFQMMMLANKFGDQAPLSTSNRRKSGTKFFGGRDRSKASKIVVGRQVLVASGRMKGEIGVVVKGSNGYFTIKFPKEFESLKDSDNSIMKRSTDLRLIESHMITEDGQYINLPPLSEDDENADNTSSRSTGSTPRSKSVGNTPRSKTSTPRKPRHSASSSSSSSTPSRSKDALTAPLPATSAESTEETTANKENLSPVVTISSASAPVSPLASPSSSKKRRSNKKRTVRRSTPLIDEATSTEDEDDHDDDHDDDDDDDDRSLQMVDENGQILHDSQVNGKAVDTKRIEKGQYVRIVLGEGRGEIGRVHYVSSENGYLYIDVEGSGKEHLKHLNDVLLITKKEAKTFQRAKAEKEEKKSKKQSTSSSSKRRSKRSRSPSPDIKSSKHSRTSSSSASVTSSSKPSSTKSTPKSLKHSKTPKPITKSPRSTKSSPRSAKQSPKDVKKPKNTEEHLQSAATLLMDLLTVPGDEETTAETDITAETDMTTDSEVKKKELEDVKMEAESEETKEEESTKPVAAEETV